MDEHVIYRQVFFTFTLIKVQNFPLFEFASKLAYDLTTISN